MKLRIVHQNRSIEEVQPTMNDDSTEANRSAPAEEVAETRDLSEEEDENSPAPEPVAVASTVSHPMLLSVSFRISVCVS